MYLPLPLLLLLPQALFGSMFLEGQGKKWPWLEGKGRSQEALLHTDCSGRLVMGRSLWRAEQIHHGGRKAKSFWSRLGNWLLVRTWGILEQVWPVDPWKPHWSFQESRWWGLFLYKGGHAAHASYVSGTEQLPLRRRRSKWPQIHVETWPPQLRI